MNMTMRPAALAALLGATAWSGFAQTALDVKASGEKSFYADKRAGNNQVSFESQSTIEDFFGVGDERTHQRTFTFDADHPAVLVGKDNGPTPVEFVLHALASCLTAGLANIAAARKVTLTEVRSTITGDIDLNGIFGLQDVRNGYEGIKVEFTIRGDASPEVLASLVEQSKSRSAVYDVITNSVPVELTIDAG